MDDVFRFDDATHTYWLGRRRLISVTEAIRLGGESNLWAVDEFAAERGKAVHAAILYELQGDLVEESIDPIVAPYLEAFRRLRRELPNLRFLPRLCERPDHEPVLLYAGTPDLVAVFNGELTLVEVKTGDFSTAGIQTAGYCALPNLRRLGIKRRTRLSVRDDGRYRLAELDDPKDAIRFFKCLEIAKNAIEKGIQNESDARRFSNPVESPSDLSSSRFCPERELPSVH